MDPLTTPSTPAATPAPAASPAPSSAPASTPAAPSSASGPGFSGVASGSGTPDPTPSVPASTMPGFNAASSPASAAAQAAQTPPAAPDFNTQFQQRYGMTPEQAQMLISMGYKTYQGQQTPPAAATQPQQPATPQNPFGLPKFDMGLLSLVGRDPATGALVNLPGAPPDAAWQVQQYQEKLKEAQQGFFQDPMKYLGDQIAERVRAEAAKVYEQQFGGYQQQQQAEQILTENASWLYATDTNGQVQQQFNPATGRMEKQLSPYGQYYAQQVQQLVNAGVRDPRLQHQLATQALQNALLIQERQRQQAPAAGAAAGAAFTQQAATNPPPAAPPPSHNVPPANPELSLKERLRRQMDANGLSNDIVNAQLRGVA